VDKKLIEPGFNRVEQAAAIGSIIGRMIHPGSERETHRWLQQNTGLGELIEHDFATTSLTRLYEVSDKLLAHQSALESHLAQREQALFQLERSIVLYDLTNTYFEGQALGNAKAAFARVKERRSDCPLVTLGLVLDSDGFALHSRIFSGNASEPKTLQEMITSLHTASQQSPTIVLDAGLASQENIDWLAEHDYRYIVVSRERYKEIPHLDDGAVVVKYTQEDADVIAKRVDCKETGEVRLYCHSPLREKKDNAIRHRFGQQFEQALDKLNDGLSKKGTVKSYEKIIERIGKLKQRYARVASYYAIDIVADSKKIKALQIHWQKNQQAYKKAQQAGVYCLRSNLTDWDEQTLWRTYVMLTEVESSFRSMKTELGLRPIYHQKETRVTAHLFITLLAYHLVHSLRYQLRSKGIRLSWESLRTILSNQHRITLSMHTKEGDSIHMRSTTKACVEQQKIYQALGLADDTLGKRKTVFTV